MLVKINIFFLLFFLSTAFIFSADFKKIDNINHEGKYEDALKILKDEFNPKDPDSAIIWRIGELIYDIADQIDDKNRKQKAEKFTEGLDFLKTYLDIKNGDKTDRAKIYHFYAANLGARGKVIGIKESLGILPDLYYYSSKAIETDPEFGGAYLMVAEIDETLCPYLVMGGDYYRMGINFSKALKFNFENLKFIYDSARGFSTRNWDVKKKKDETDKWNKRKNSISQKGNKDKKITDADRKKLLKDYEVECTDDGTPAEKTDHEYAAELFQILFEKYEAKKEPSLIETECYKNGKKLFKKISN